MREQHSIPNEYPEAWDDGTYQTGATAPHKAKNGFVTVLLMLVIFLSGFASALGMVNIRLLSRLEVQEGEPLQLSVMEPGVSDLLRDTTDPVPSLPEGGMPALVLQDAPSQSAAAASGKDILAQNIRSMVRISCDTRYGTKRSGLGVAIGGDGYILTNACVITDVSRIQVYLFDGSCRPAVLVGSDPMADLALLYVAEADLVPVELGSAHSLRFGETVYAMTNAATYEMSEGKLYTVDRLFRLGDQTWKMMQSGIRSSFGPVFNGYGQMVGYNVGCICRYFDIHLTEGQGIALSSNQVADILAQLAAKGTVSGRPTLGLEVETVSKLYQQYWNLPGGLQITGMAEGSQGQRLNLRIGDILLELDGKRLTNLEELYEILYTSCPGDSHSVVIARGDQRFTVTMTTERTP